MEESGGCLKPRAGPALELFTAMFLLALTITFLHSQQPPRPPSSNLDSFLFAPPESSAFLPSFPPSFPPSFLPSSRLFS